MTDDVPDLLSAEATSPAPSVSLPLSQRPIALVGMMGVGKTTVGRRLAKRLDRPFFDSDQEIETASGRTVSGYFRDHGEAAFRDGERRVIVRLLKEGPCILATGGGAFVTPETQALLRAQAITVWLRGDLDTIMARVSRNNKRPLLQVADPRAKLAELLAAREPEYAKADITIDIARGPHIRTVRRVIRAVDKYKSRQQRRAHAR